MYYYQILIIHIIYITCRVDAVDKTYSFTLLEDTYQLEQEKRWVVVSPPGSNGTTILLARASKPEQEPFIGNQVREEFFFS